MNGEKLMILLSLLYQIFYSLLYPPQVVTETHNTTHKELFIMFDDYLWFEGVPLPSLGFKPEIIRELRDNFVVKDEDIVTLSYPKSGKESDS
jgi:hypothetical protein